MASPTDIANLALALIGDMQITSLTETTDEPSRVCAVNYDQARDECLAIARWGFAKQQVTLSRLEDDPLFKWTAAFQLPADFIRLVEIEGADAWMPKEYFDVQGSKLFLDLDDSEATTLNIEQIRREDDTTLYSPLFIEALSYKLAHKICVRLTNSASKAREILKEFQQVVLPRCQTVDAQQRYSGENHPINKILRRSHLVRSRGDGFDDF